jgi:hypothetical protein
MIIVIKRSKIIKYKNIIPSNIRVSLYEQISSASTLQKMWGISKATQCKKDIVYAASMIS